MGAQNFNHLEKNREGLLARSIRKVQKIGREINNTTRSARRAALAITLGTSAALVGVKMMPQAHATEVLALTQGGDNTVTLINPSSGTTIQEVTLSGGSSARGGGVVVSETMNAVYVAHRNGTSSSVSEFADLTSAIRTNNVTVSGDTYDLVEDSSTNTLIGITNEEVYTVDEATMSLNGTSSSVSSGDFTHLTVLTPGSEVAVSDWGNDQVQIFDISTSTPSLLASWDMGGAGACGITLDENSGYLIVTGCDDNTINWVNPTTGSIENSMSSPMSGGAPWQAIVDSSGNLWVTDQWTSEGDVDLTILQDGDGDNFQETTIQTFAIGEVPTMTQFNGYTHLGTMQSSSEDWVMIHQSTYAYTELDISSFSGSPDYMGAGNITDVDGDSHNAEDDGGDDCDDLDATINPDEAEICDDGIDNDCDGGDASCSGTDADGDGHDSTGTGGDDCDDTNAAVSPSEPETPYDGTDNDCNSSTPDDDLDEDGHNNTATGGDDCDDADPDINPDQTEICDDGDDNDCYDGDEACPPEDDDNDGVPNDTDICPDTPTDEVANTDGCSPSQLTTTHDEDEDGHEDINYGGDDCDDNDPNTHPDADEILVDGKDQDCDELVDDIANAVLLTGVQGSFSYTVDPDTKQITITPENNTWENGDISGYRIDSSWNVDVILTGEDGAGYSLGAYGSGWNVQFTGQMRYITTLEPTLSLERDDVAFGYLNNAGATATVDEDTNEVTADTDGDGQEEVLIPAEGSGDDSGDDDNDSGNDTGVNPPTGPDCGGCKTIPGQTTPRGVIETVGVLVLALLRRRKEPDLKKAA